MKVCTLPYIPSRYRVIMVCMLCKALSVVAVLQSSVAGVQAVDVLIRGETSVTLTEYIIVFGCANLLLAQCPHFHAIRYINAVATVCTISFSIIAVAMSIYDGQHPSPCS